MCIHETMADNHEALERGQDNPERAWVLTARDVWHKNPFYSGPKVPHPEDDDAYEYIADHGIEAWRAAIIEPVVWVDIPF